VAHGGRWTLVVAMARPTDLDALDDISNASGMGVQGVAADEREILAVLARGSTPDGDPEPAQGWAAPSLAWVPLFEVARPAIATDWVI
jgi:hypothetical protein